MPFLPISHARTAVAATALLIWPICAGLAQSIISPDYGKPLAAIERSIDGKRMELHVPGAALVIVKNGKVIYLHGLGLRNVAKKLPVTPNTLFAIGSSTKAFTAMAAMMSVDDGKLNLAASPHTYLPYFKLRDPDANKRITVSDLLCHRSGLERTDLLWAGNVLNSEQLIRALAFVKPTAKLGEKFQYQNLMFLTAGQIVAKVQARPWTEVIASRIFQQLGMTSSNTAIRAMQASQDHALGYTFESETGALTQLPMRDLTFIAPAGAVNSNAVDMGKWVRFMLNSGRVNGKALVSARSFHELTVPRIAVGGGIMYGYGWMLRTWNGHKVVEHGGNIDGFNAEVAFMPDQNLGFALLTNVTISSLGETTQTAVWENLVTHTQESTLEVTPDMAVGVYHSSELNIDFNVALAASKLTVTRTGGASPYPLVHISGGKFKLGDPAPEGIFMTFRPSKPNPKTLDMVLEQGGAQFVFKRASTAAADGSPTTPKYSGPLADLLASYKATAAPLTVEIAVRDGKVALVVPGQPTYPLVETSKDNYTLGGLPPPFALTIHRNSAGVVVGATVHQPAAQGELELTRIGAPAVAAPALPSADVVMQKAIDAVGGEETLKRHHSLVMEMRLEKPTQGVTGTERVVKRAPNSAEAKIEFFALGKRLLMQRDYFDGVAGGAETSIAPSTRKSDKEAAAARRDDSFYAPLEWKTLFKTVSVTGIEKVDGQDAYIVELHPPEGDPRTDYISTTTFRILKRVTLVPIPGVGKIPASETYKDWHTVDGLIVPFTRIESSPLGSDTTSTVTSLKFDVAVPDSAFKPTRKPASPH